jgi:hypothetical protein
MTTKQKLQKIMSDFNLFCKNFVKIVDNDGELIPFVLNDQQKDFINKAGRFNFILKPRQLGFTTLSLAYCLWMAITNPNTSYLVVSYKGESAKDLFEKIKKMNNHLPREKYKVFPDVKRDNRDELVFSNGSRIVSTTTGTKDLGRGMTLMYILLSEAAFYDDLEGVLNSLESSLAKSDKARIVIETTANGFNYAQRLYVKAKKEQSKYRAFFYPFFSSAYEKQFKYDIDQAVSWFKANNKGKPLSSYDLNKEEKQLYELGCSLRMLMWRQFVLQDKNKNQFYQEYPAFDLQAFISTGVSVFDQTKILDALNNVIPSLTRDELIKEKLSEHLLQYVGRGLEIYALPKRGIRYFGGVDVASGNGHGDYSTITILSSDGEQMASFNRNDVPIYRFVDVVRDLGKYFNYCFYVIERNGFGTSLLERLRKDTNDPYLNLYRYRHFDAKGGSDYKLGFPTVALTKNQITTDTKEAFETGLIKVNCRETLTQMQTYSDSGNNRIDGHHHDLVTSLMMAVQGLKANRYYVDIA